MCSNSINGACFLFPQENSPLTRLFLQFKFEFVEQDASNQSSALGSITRNQDPITNAGFRLT